MIVVSNKDNASEEIVNALAEDFNPVNIPIDEIKKAVENSAPNPNAIVRQVVNILLDKNIGEGCCIVIKECDPLIIDHYEVIKKCIEKGEAYIFVESECVEESCDGLYIEPLFYSNSKVIRVAISSKNQTPEKNIYEKIKNYLDFNK